MKNAVGRDIPEYILTDGREVFQGNNYRDGMEYKKPGPKVKAYIKPQESKIIASIKEAVQLCGVRDGGITIGKGLIRRGGDSVFFHQSF